MIIAKLEILLHDRSVVQISRTDSGTVYVELLAPMTLRDGHGLAVKGSAMLTEVDVNALMALLTPGGGSSVASGMTAGTAGDGHRPAPINSSTRR
jgi:hypothetical protein